MSYLPSRLAVALTVLLTVLVSAFVEPASAQTVRKSITALSSAELMSLRRGVAVMMSRNTASRGSADFRRSWIYWANMHGHFGSDCRGPIVGNGMSGLQQWTASNPSETSTWCKCEHGTPQFLTWHRMFLYYFERVLRQAANDPGLRLPYWDYATTARLPPALRDATYVNENGQSVPNPLRVAARRAQLNSGQAGLASGATSSANAMLATTRSQFEQRIEATPHGTVHCAIPNGGCPNGLMGAVPVAALDPVFYLHHVNIDRLYDCWLRVDEAARLPTGQSVLTRRYAFIDSDGSVRQRQVGDMLRTSQLGYSYSAGAGCPGASATAPVAAAATTELAAQATQSAEAAQPAPMTVVAQSGAVELKRGMTEVPIAVESNPNPATAAPDAGRSATAPPKSAIVTIEGVNAAVVPGVLYNVYLANDAGQRVQIGVIDFFDFGGPMAGGKHGHGGAKGKSFEFDATDAVKALGLTGTKNPKLVFEPTTGLADSTVAAATEAIPPDAKVTFSSARLRVTR